MAFGAVGCRKDKMPLVFLSGKIVQNPVKMYTPFFFRVCHSALRAENSNFVVKGRNRMRYLLLFCVCVLAVFDSRVYGKVILKSWQMTTFHGLPNNTVRCLHQDYRGRIWLGTQNGLGMYDGNRVTTFVPVSTDRRVVLSRKIRQIEETSSRHLWILAAGGQAMCFDLCGRRFIAVTPRGDLFLPADHLSKDRRGRIWLWHSRRKGAWCVSDTCNGGGKLPLRYYPFPAPVSLVADAGRGDRVWVGTRKGLYVVSDVGCLVADASGEWTSSSVTDGHGLCLSTRCGRIVCVGSGSRLEREVHLPVGGCVTGLSWWRDRVVVLTDSITYFYDPSCGTWGVHPHLQLPGGHVVASLSDSEWLADGTGWLTALCDSSSVVMRLRVMDRHEVSMADSERYGVLSDSRGLLWISTYGGGLCVYDPSDGSLSRYRASDRCPAVGSDYLYGVLEDRTGHLWAGQQNGGVARMFVIRDGVSRLLSASSCSSSGRMEVKAVVAGEGTDMVVSCRDGRVYFYDGASLSVRDCAYAPSPVYALWHDALSGRLWYATRHHGLYVAEGRDLPRFGEHAVLPYAVFAMMTDSLGDCWAGTFGHGLLRGHRQNGGRWEFTDPFEGRCPFRQVRALSADAAGRMWAATERGILLFSPAGLRAGTFTWRLFNPSCCALPGEEINTLYVAPDGRVWAGLTGHGVAVCRLRGDSQLEVKVYDEGDGLTGNEVQAVVEDEHGTIWVSTQYGLCWFDEEAGRFRACYLSSTFQGDIYSVGAACRGPLGRLWLGTQDGVAVVSPERMVQDGRLPQKPLLMEVKADGATIYPQENDEGGVLPFTVGPGEANLDFVFSNLDYSRFRSSRYSFLLEGYDSDWSVPSEGGVIGYRRLPPGRYRLRVRACNSAGVWAAEETRLDFTVARPAWQSGWAMTLYAVVLLGMLLSAVAVMIRIGKFKRKVAFERELSAFKLRFFIRMAREVRQPLQRLCELTSRGSWGEQTRREVHAEGQRMERILGQVMTFGQESDRLYAADTEEADSGQATVVENGAEGTVNRMTEEQAVAEVSTVKDFTLRLEETVRRHLSDPAFTVDELARQMEYRRTTCYRKVKELTGMTPNDYLRTARLKRAAELLLDDRLNVTEVAYKVGFEDPSYFSKCFKAYFGMAPSGFAKNRNRQKD